MTMKDTDAGMPDVNDDMNDITSKLSSLLGGPEAEDEESSTEADPALDDDAPETASEEGAESDEPATPAIEPPASWDAEAKAKWRALPPDVQELISTREMERDRATSMKLQEAAEVRRAVEAQSAETARMRDAYEQRLVAFARHLDATVPEEFRGIRSAADLVRLADTNPALVTKFHAWQAQVSSIAQEMGQIEQQKAYEMEQQRSSVLAREFETLAEVWPDFVDPQKGQAIRSEITSYARGLGFSEAEIASLADHRLVLLLRDAIAGRRASTSLQTAKQKVTAKPLPKVVKPGSGEQSGRKGVDQGVARRVAQSGSMNDITKTLERMLSS